MRRTDSMPKLDARGTNKSNSLAHHFHMAFVSVITLSAMLTQLTIAHADRETCTHVDTAALNMTGIEIAGSKMQEADDGLPKHFIVTG
jgi:hypothetical protein